MEGERVNRPLIVASKPKGWPSDPPLAVLTQSNNVHVDAMYVAEDGDVGNPIMSQIVNAAIACTDALTARYGGTSNRQDHAAAVKTLRDCLGNRLPPAQETRLRRTLGEKDEIQYGARLKTGAEAAVMLAQLEEFAAWAEAEFERKP